MSVRQTYFKTFCPTRFSAQSTRFVWTESDKNLCPVELLNWVSLTEVGSSEHGERRLAKDNAAQTDDTETIDTTNVGLRASSQRLDMRESWETARHVHSYTWWQAQTHLVTTCTVYKVHNALSVICSHRTNGRIHRPLVRHETTLHFINNNRSTSRTPNLIPLIICLST